RQRRITGAAGINQRERAISAVVAQQADGTREPSDADGDVSATLGFAFDDLKQLGASGSIPRVKPHAPWLSVNALVECFEEYFDVGIAQHVVHARRRVQDADPRQTARLARLHRPTAAVSYIQSRIDAAFSYRR